MIMDGKSHDVGAVGALRRIKGAISVARQVMERTDHTLLVGSQAADFAIMMGFLEENLTTQVSESMYAAWKAKNCQPNFWRGVEPDPKRFCGPYTRPLKVNTKQYTKKKTSYMINLNNHDTIGMVAIDDLGHIAAGTSTNGANHKIPGRVGDSPIPGSGAYVDRNVGGAAATGDGDVMMRFMPSLVAVDYLRFGLSPDDAANAALERITSFYPSFSGAVVTLSINGTYGAACYNLPDDIFHYSVGSVSLGGVEVLTVPCVDEVN